MENTNSHRIIVSTFRSPYIYILRFIPSSSSATSRTAILERQSSQTAFSGHSWLDISQNRKFLYATGWGDPATVVAYRIEEEPVLKVHLLNTAQSPHLSGYVVASHDNKFLFSASGPQVDVFSLNENTGAFLEREEKSAIQTISLLNNDEEKKRFFNSNMEFGGLKSGGHSADLSPDGKILYVADIGRNCVHMFRVNTDNAQNPLTLVSRNVAKQRHDDGPRHTWPHPNGRIVYSLQEHSSFIDILEVMDDDSLKWRQGVSIIPKGESCTDYWADEVRLSPSLKTLFGSTRGLKTETKGWVSAYLLDPETGLLDSISPEEQRDPYSCFASLHRTSTSGGLANAISICPIEYDKGTVYLTLTDSEVGLLQILQWKIESGFKVVAEENFSKEEHIQISVAVWYD